jgi:WD40 repeat protein
VALSPGGEFLAVAGHKDLTVRLFEARRGEEVRRMACPDMVPACLAFSPDGRTLVGGGHCGVRLWDTGTGRDWHADRPGHSLAVTAVAFAPDGKTLLSGGREGSARLWDTRTGKQRREWWDFGGQITQVAFGPDGGSVAAAGGGRAFVLDPATGDRRLTFTGEPMYHLDVAFSPDGRTLAVAEGKCRIRLRAADGGRLLRELTGQPQRLLAPPVLTFSPDGRLVAGFHDERLRLWDVATGRERPALEGGWKDVYACWPRFSPDGETLAAVSGTALTFWDVPTGKKLRRLEVFTTRKTPDITAFALAPDGRTFLLATSDGQLRCHELASGEERFQVALPGGPVEALAFSPDGRLLATGNADTTVLVWDWLALPAPLPDPGKLTPEDAERRWTTLADPNAEKAYGAIRTLAAAPDQGVPLMRRHLKPVPKPDDALVKRLLAELDSDEFAVREAAAARLEALADSAAPALRAAAGSSSPEVRRRAEELLAKLDGASGESLRQLRAVEALERAGTPQARQLLEELAAGLPEARLTREAAAALKRLPARP